MAVNIEVSGIQPFDSTGDSTSVSPRWKRWRKSFQFFVEAKGIEEAKQKKALLLHCAGVDVQEIFEALDNSEAGVSSKASKTDDEYEIALKILDEYFSPKANVPYERHVFRQMKQEDGETVDQFVVKLKNQAKNCSFGDSFAEQIRDQVIDKCRSSRLRKRLLEKSGELNLGDVQQIARAMEAIDIQAKKMELPSSISEKVNQIQKSKDMPMAVRMVQVVNPTFVFGVDVKVTTLVINVALPNQLLAGNVKMLVILQQCASRR